MPLPCTTPQLSCVTTESDDGRRCEEFVYDRPPFRRTSGSVVSRHWPSTGAPVSMWMLPHVHLPTAPIMRSPDATRAIATPGQDARRPPAGPLQRLLLQEDLNFLLTNRIPRRLVTRFVGWFARLESRTLTRLTLALWQSVADDLRLDESDAQDFPSLHACFTRRLRAGARPIAADPAVLVSPCDAEVGAMGRIDADTLVQAKGMPYRLQELLLDPALAEQHRGGWFVTLRLKANMYHRFHAPCDARVERVRYISGDTWNVNPIALARVERLFCRNERVVLDLQLPVAGAALTLVPVAAILVASIRLHALPFPLDLQYRGANDLPCDWAVRKGEEMGYFENGSTIIVLASGALAPCETLCEGLTIRMGEPLLVHDAAPRASAPTAPRAAVPLPTPSIHA